MKNSNHNVDGRNLTIGIVLSRFNTEVGNGLRDACIEMLRKQGVAEDNISLVSVPGALEIPIALQKLAQTQRFDALIALGAVIRGDTFHFEIVALESARGINLVQLDTGVPIANAILTTNDDAQAIARMREKGAEAALVAIEMANLLKQSL